MGSESTVRTPASGADLATALRAQKRRVLAALADGEPIDASPIVADREAFGAEEYTTLVYELHRVYLPELADAGLVEFDLGEDEVRRGPRFEAVRADLEAGDVGDGR